MKFAFTHKVILSTNLLIFFMLYVYTSAVLILTQSQLYNTHLNCEYTMFGNICKMKLL